MPINKTEKIWFNGKLVDWDKAQTHILSHALHYGSGVFEGIRCYKTNKGPAVFRLREHVERLFTSAELYFMEVPYDVGEIEEAVKGLIKANKLDACYIRPIIYRGYGEMGLNPLKAPVDTAIAVWPWGTYLGEEGLKKGIKVMISSVERFNSNIVPTRAKATGQYINSILAKLQSLKSGYDEAIMLDNRGMISEGPGENLFIVRDKVIYTPPEHASLLMGITRDSIVRIARDMNYEVVETDMDRGMLYTADEAFFTGTAAEVTPIREVDGHTIGKPGPVTLEIQEKFFEIVEGKDQEYGHWLAYI
ncbi:MAG: branched-chain amino acid transaminase [Candidatus Altiarchaeales archaeon]|nr:branched-chain amino acid transaminase [Candidatus Altiarchaeales archaeon]MBD3417205.1 branched-chain amino acid transaminase [Candidatus Altiarchaeales archaeon]